MSRAQKKCHRIQPHQAKSHLCTLVRYDIYKLNTGGAACRSALLAENTVECLLMYLLYATCMHSIPGPGIHCGFPRYLGTAAVADHLFGKGQSSKGLMSILCLACVHTALPRPQGEVRKGPPEARQLDGSCNRTTKKQRERESGARARIKGCAWYTSSNTWLTLSTLRP